MAAYIDLRGLYNDADLRNRVVVAVSIEAQMIIAAADGTETGLALDKVAWAQKVLDSLQSVQNCGQTMLIYLLAADNALSTAQIQGASDAALQTRVSEAVAGMALGAAGQ